MILTGELLISILMERMIYLKEDEKRCLRNTPNDLEYSRDASDVIWMKEDSNGGEKKER